MKIFGKQIFKNGPEKRDITIAVISAAFILAAVSAALLGADIYKTVSSSDMLTADDSARSYIARSISSCEDKSGIRTATLGGSQPALVIPDGDGRETWVYADDGYLTCISAASSEDVTSVPPGKEKRIAPLAGIDFGLTGSGLLTIDMTADDGRDISFCIDLYGYGGDDVEGSD